MQLIFSIFELLLKCRIIIEICMHSLHNQDLVRLVTGPTLAKMSWKAFEIPRRARNSLLKPKNGFWMIATQALTGILDSILIYALSCFVNLVN